MRQPRQVGKALSSVVGRQGSYDRKLQQVLELHNVTSENPKVATKKNTRAFHASSCRLPNTSRSNSIIAVITSSPFTRIMVVPPWPLEMLPASIYVQLPYD
ncbi:hypothetical protein HBH44_112460 [Parastagonospora nodorum]|nr:hypothetical protein HBH45_026800 [Parastagonospora nodorum]KAH4159038.1 hypothetical protein HBH44_112460 [Parastagonospora nodorum]KAH4569775.1 hypothetical protein HBH84_123000 [Parastagonospora nodorum]KAH5472801.1 hypothetical protein HBI28_132450 [Parastagonospora nodorum]